MNQPEHRNSNTQASRASSTAPNCERGYSPRSTHQQPPVAWRFNAQEDSLPRQRIQHLDRFAKGVAALESLRIGALVCFNGFIIRRENEETFHFEHAGEAMLGSAGTVVDWIEQLTKYTSGTKR